jgi:hypothetical protein
MRIAIALISLLHLVTSCGLAEAGLYTFHFSGTVGGVTDPLNLNPPLHPGLKVVGSYSFDPETPDLNSRSEIGLYALVSGRVRVGRDHIETSFPSHIAIFNDIPEFGFDDQYGVTFRDVSSTSTSTFDFFLFDSSGTAFTSDDLPLTPPDLQDFFAPAFGMWRYFAADRIQLLANATVQIDSSEVARVPQPSPLLLLSFSLAVLAAYHLLRRRA